MQKKIWGKFYFLKIFWPFFCFLRPASGHGRLGHPQSLEYFCSYRTCWCRFSLTIWLVLVNILFNIDRIGCFIVAAWRKIFQLSNFCLQNFATFVPIFFLLKSTLSSKTKAHFSSQSSHASLVPVVVPLQ